MTTAADLERFVDEYRERRERSWCPQPPRDEGFVLRVKELVSEADEAARELAMEHGLMPVPSCSWPRRGTAEPESVKTPALSDGTPTPQRLSGPKIVLMGNVFEKPDEILMPIQRQRRICRQRRLNNQCVTCGCDRDDFTMHCHNCYQRHYQRKQKGLKHREIPNRIDLVGYRRHHKHLEGPTRGFRRMIVAEMDAQLMVYWRETGLLDPNCGKCPSRNACKRVGKCLLSPDCRI